MRTSSYNLTRRTARPSQSGGSGRVPWSAGGRQALRGTPRRPPTGFPERTVGWRARAPHAPSTVWNLQPPPQAFLGVGEKHWTPSHPPRKGKRNTASSAEVPTVRRSGLAPPPTGEAAHSPREASSPDHGGELPGPTPLTTRMQARPRCTPQVHSSMKAWPGGLSQEGKD